MKREYKMITVKEYLERHLNEDDNYALISVEKYLEELNKDKKIA